MRWYVFASYNRCRATNCFYRHFEWHVYFPETWKKYTKLSTSVSINLGLFIQYYLGHHIRLTASLHFFLLHLQNASNVPLPDILRLANIFNVRTLKLTESRRWRIYQIKTTPKEPETDKKVCIPKKNGLDKCDVNGRERKRVSSRFIHIYVSGDYKQMVHTHTQTCVFRFPESSNNVCMVLSMLETH